MSEVKVKHLQLTDPELRKMLGVCAKEIIPMLCRNDMDPVLLSLLRKGAAALAPESEEDAKEKISA